MAEGVGKPSHGIGWMPQGGCSGTSGHDLPVLLKGHTHASEIYVAWVDCTVAEHKSSG
ncbi:hypothetical protein D3C76_1620460 [compost metagenome]